MSVRAFSIVLRISIERFLWACKNDLYELVLIDGKKISEVQNGLL